MVCVPAVVVRYGILSVGKDPRLLSPACKVAVELLLLDRWYRGLIVSFGLALRLFLVSGPPVIV